MQKIKSPRHVELAHVSRNDWIVLAVVIQDYIIVYIYMCNESCFSRATHIWTNETLLAGAYYPETLFNF